MYKNILVAVDNSEVGTEALKKAIKLVKEQQAKLRIIHVVNEYYVDWIGLGIGYEEFMKVAKKEGQKVLKKAENIAKKAKVKFDSRLIELAAFQGRIAEKIVEESKIWSADLILLGTHGRSGFHHLLLGSVAEGVVRLTSIPVLLIPAERTS